MLKNISNNLEYFGSKNAKIMGAFHHFMEVSESEGKLDKKTKELISLALAVKSQCKYCIAFHVKNCLDLGVSEEEMLEAAWVAVLMGGGPSLMYMQLVKEAIEQIKEA
ncbi:alkylhydroperoxidase [Candidatus Woesearchaeota archaeon ex4484_78]|nr:MAG: alkylhydroperoxidase [Candidatus Woesearchaeota archaeon ex4484_78]